MIYADMNGEMAQVDKPEIKISIYPLVEKEDVFEDIKAQIMRIQEDSDVSNIELDLAISCMDQENESFLNNLEFLCAVYIEEGNRKILQPALYDSDKHLTYHIIDIQKKINAIPIYVIYCCKAGVLDKSMEYGSYYKSEPVYTKDILYPDIDIIDRLQQLQIYIDRISERESTENRTQEIEREEPDI